MKKIVMILSLITLIAFTMPYLSVSISAEDTYYKSIDVNAAYSYAEKYWSNYNTDEYRSYKGQQSDCMNYCSQLLHAAGLPENEKWHGSYSYGGNPTSSFTYIPDFIAYVRSEMGIPYYNKTALSDSYKDGSYFSADDIQPGDLVTYNGTWGRSHVFFVLGRDGNTLSVTAHTNDRFQYNISVSLIQGVLKTSQITLKVEQNDEQVNSYVLYGDVNEDGKVNITDLSKLNLYLTNSSSYPLNNYAAADVNLDGMINQEDRTLLQKYLVHLIDELPYFQAGTELNIKGSIVMLKSVKHNGYVWDVYGGYTDNETPLSLYEQHNGINQFFYASDAENGYITLNPLYAANMSVDIHGTTGYVQIYPTHYGINQRFKVIRTGDSDGSVYLKSESGLYLSCNSSNPLNQLYGTSSPSIAAKWIIS